MSKLNVIVARPIAAEDIQPGVYLQVLSETYQFPSFYWDCGDSFSSRRDQPVTIEFLPFQTRVPLLVKVVTLPMLLVKNHDGQHQMMDVRRFRLAKIRRKHARQIWRTLSPLKPADVCRCRLR